MNPVMNFAQALQALFSRHLHAAEPVAAAEARPDLPPDDGALSGPSFVKQEPALSRELHLTSEDMSGWAMGGSSLSD